MGDFLTFIFGVYLGIYTTDDFVSMSVANDPIHLLSMIFTSCEKTFVYTITEICVVEYILDDTKFRTTHHSYFLTFNYLGCVELCYDLVVYLFF